MDARKWFQYHRVSGDRNLIQLSSAAESGSVDVAADESFDRAPTTRMLAIAGLTASWIFGIICVVFGSGNILKPTISVASKNTTQRYHNWPQLNISSVAGELLPLLVNTIVTLLVEGMGLIHSTTLRWTLCDRLAFNSNLRIFTASDKHACLGKVSNFLHAVFLIMTYAGASLMIATSPTESFCNNVSGVGQDKEQGCGDMVVLSTPSLSCLGVGFLGQAALTTWQFFDISVPTWSTNPLDTAWASISTGSRTRVAGRCMMSVHDAEIPTAPRQTQPQQQSIWKSHSEARWVMSYNWLVTWILLLIFIIVQVVLVERDKYFKGSDERCNGCNVYLGTNWNLLRDSGSAPMSAAIIVEYSPRIYAGLWIVFAILQGILTLALHCADLIIAVSRDEDTWRKCYAQTIRGDLRPNAQTIRRNLRPNALIRAATSWLAVMVFLLKVVLHWLFGNAISYAYNWGIFLRPPPLLYLSIGSFLLSAFVTYVCFRRPGGEQPATFGHIQTLVNLIDVWHLDLFWGDKGAARDGPEGVRHAGTASRPLEEVIQGQLYE
ncbi:hypothetical protein N7505_008673 [Penicillium chrysogenum]|jgi:hypothetical protein|uniref:Choline transport protein n=1 Tax=Penicillium chrysogenum TaxID=5076 RepID=A0ABQ8WB70_PENCH|nr:hypothetical protein N7505_008673 [Penicillium chrysogenum]